MPAMKRKVLEMSCTAKGDEMEGTAKGDEMEGSVYCFLLQQLY